MNKKTLIILGTIIGIIIIGIILFFVFKPEEIEAPREKEIIDFFFPETREENGLIPTPTIPEEEILEEEITQPIRQLIQITNIPTIGATFHEQTNKVRYFERSTGHLYELTTQGREKKQLTITTIPKIFEALWSKDSTSVILRYVGLEINDIQTFLVTQTPTTTPQEPEEIEGVFLPLNVLSVANSQAADEIFYLTDTTDQSKGIVATINNKNQEEVFNSSFKDFLASWPQKNTITLQTKSSAFKDGYLYKLNPNTESFTKILGGIKGLTTLYFPIEDKVLYSQSIGRTFTTKLYDTEKGTHSSFTYTTLPEKCIFGKKNTDILYCAIPKRIPSAYYPDDWYKGKISFDDVLWQLDLKNGATKIILDKEGFDITNLFTNTEENYLFFQNKKDSTLWSLRLEE